MSFYSSKFCLFWFTSLPLEKRHILTVELRFLWRWQRFQEVGCLLFVASNSGVFSCPGVAVDTFALTPILTWTLKTLKVSGHERVHKTYRAANSTAPLICFSRLLLPNVRFFLFFLRFWCNFCCYVCCVGVFVCVRLWCVCGYGVFFMHVVVLLITRTALTDEQICKELEQTWGEFSCLNARPLPL